MLFGKDPYCSSYKMLFSEMEKNFKIWILFERKNKKIKNLIVRKSLEERYSDFMFWYNNADEQIYSDKGRNNDTESQDSKMEEVL